MTKQEWVVTSNRLRWPEGKRLSVDDLYACNIEALVAAGHLAVAPRKADAVTAPQETD